MSGISFFDHCQPLKFIKSFNYELPHIYTSIFRSFLHTSHNFHSIRKSNDRTMKRKTLPSSLSTSFWSRLTDFSACSARFSASFNRIVSVFISRLNSSTLWLAFSSDTSRDLSEFPTTCNRLRE